MNRSSNTQVNNEQLKIESIPVQEKYSARHSKENIIELAGTQPLYSSPFQK
jgi:hypothetical protein